MKNILLIGGSYGIGLAIAQELQNENNIFVASRTNENLSGLNVTYIPFDASTDTLDTSTLRFHGFKKSCILDNIFITLIFYCCKYTKSL